MKRLLTWKTILISSMLLLVCSTFFLWAFNSNESAKSKQTITSYATWPGYTFESAVDTATTVIHGKVLSKSDTLVHEATDSDGGVHKEYYKEVTIEVIDQAKGAETLKEIVYLEMGGETNEAIYRVDGIVPVNENEEYVFFLNEHGAFLSPMTLIPVSEGIVSYENKISPVRLVEKSTDIKLSDVSEYMNAVKEIARMYGGKNQ